MRKRRTTAMLALSVTLFLCLTTSCHALAASANATSPADSPFAVLERSAWCFAKDSEVESLSVEPRHTNDTKTLDVDVTNTKTPDVALPAATTTPIIEHVVPTSLVFPQEPPATVLPVQGTVLDALGDVSGEADFPSFADWKQRHLANAASSALKDSQNNHGSKRHAAGGPDGKKYNTSRDGHGKEARERDALGTKQESARDDADSLEPILVTEDIEDGGVPPSDLSVSAISPPRLLHPVPHSGTGDPLLDPLIALRDRTNYASFDCSATLIRSSKSTKSASAILSSKKDRYMLSPCSAKEKFVIVELCDEIQIDTIVLANLEFFSSMFKLFRVTAGTAYPESVGTWHELGSFRASNVRGMQVFRPPEPSGGGFYRYIRIDFLSHYGTEYYCPVSILKVFGLNQLDAYRRDQERDARLAEAGGGILVEGELDEPLDTKEPEHQTVFLKLVEPEAAANDAARTVSVEVEVPEIPATSGSSEPRFEVSSSLVFETTGTLLPISATKTSIQEHVHRPTLSVASTTPDSVKPVSTDSFVPTGNATSGQQSTSTLSPSGSAPSTKSGTAHLSTSQRPSIEAPPPSADSSPTSGVDSSSSSILPSSLAHGSIPTSIEAQEAPTDARPNTDSNSAKRSSATPGLPEVTPILSVTEAVILSSPSSDASFIRAASNPSIASKPSRNASKSTSTSATLAKTSVSSSSSKASSSSPLVYRTVTTAIPQPHQQQKRNDTRAPPHQVVYAQGSNPQPNESIYGTIMKRLLALEVNSTLSTAYLEEQMKSVRYTFRKIEDKLGGMEQSRVKQDQLLRRLMLDLELHRAKIEAERVELSVQLNILSREMTLEKRLGMAQLLALIVLLFFVILTRGSPSTPFLALPNPSSLPSSFPRSARSARPKSVIDGIPPTAYTNRDTNNVRDRRSLGPDRKAAATNGSSGMTRSTSLKRPIRLSNNMKRPFSPPSAAPYRATSDDNVLISDAILPEVPTNRPPYTAPLQRDAPGSYIQSTPTRKDGTLLEEERSLSASTLRGPSPSGSQRNSPVDAIKRKLKLMQPRRGASLDGSADLPPRPQTASVLDRRKLFTFGPAAHRRGTVGSVDEQERNARAWQSTSEDSAEESGELASLRGQSSKWPSTFPPSPDPSDAEQVTT